jgi:predicted nuclease with TOPRIM domain
VAKFDKDDGWLLWLYKCKSCKSLVKNINGFMLEMRTAMESLKTRVVKLESDRDTMAQEIECLKTENKVLKERLEKADDRTSMVSGVVSELEERQRRKDNIILFDVTESESEDSQTRKKDDLLEASHVLAKAGLKANNVVTIYRIGPKRDGSRRPLCLTLTGADVKVTLKELWKHKIKCSFDQTKMQREEYQKFKTARGNGKMKFSIWRRKTLTKSNQ